MFVSGPTVDPLGRCRLCPISPPRCAVCRSRAPRRYHRLRLHEQLKTEVQNGKIRLTKQTEVLTHETHVHVSRLHESNELREPKLLFFRVSNLYVLNFRFLLFM